MKINGDCLYCPRGGWRSAKRWEKIEKGAAGSRAWIMTSCRAKTRRALSDW